MDALEKANQQFDRSAYRQRKLSMLTDYYQFTMMYGYYKNKQMDQRAIFDLFFRKTPGKSGYAVVAGLEQVIWYLLNLHFTDEDLEYLRSIGFADEGFLEELRSFRFTGTLYAMPEGTIAFAQEPLFRFEGRIFELQLIESAILSMVNHQTLIATKASRIIQASQSDIHHLGVENVMEFGLRRAHNTDAAIFGSRASYIGGCHSTSNIYAGQNFHIPVVGTMSHSWVQSFTSELDAFRAYAEVFPDSTTLLVDTYNVLRSGLPNAILVASEMRDKGYELKGIRLDSGDLTYLSKEARRMLDDAGFPNVKIIASNDLDEYTIKDLIQQGAKIDGWGVGTQLITSSDSPALGGVYKLVSEEQDGRMFPTIKISENESKITTPGKKKVFRIYNEKGMATGDLIALDGEHIDPTKPLTLFDPIHTFKRKTLHKFTYEELLVPIFEMGKLVYELPELQAIRQRVQNQLDKLYPEVKRIMNPYVYHVDLSRTLWDLKHDLIDEMLHSSPTANPPRHT